MPEEQERYDTGQPEDELTSVHEAARILKLSESTVWRYSAQNILPAYRVGKKRVMFRRSDLESLLRRLRGKNERKQEMAEKELRLIPMFEGARSATDAMALSRELRARILARRDNVPVSDSWEDINAAREERTADL